jgi:general secretion pathway protein L
MTESVLSSLTDRLRLAYAASPLERLLSWWWRELLALLPARARAWFAEEREQARFTLQGTHLSVRLTRTQADEPLRFDLSTEAEAAKVEIARAIKAHEEPPLNVFCVPAERALRRTLSLPLAAEPNLRQVIAFEMDRQTPFRAEQVYFDYRIAARDAVSKQLGVDLVALPKAVIDTDLNALSGLGLALDAVDAVDGQGERLGFNLLPAERRATRPNLWLRINLGLGALMVILALLVMAKSVANREQALEALREATKTMRTEARAVATLRTTLKEAIEGANFLSERKRGQPVVIDLVLEVTRLLPNDTWLQRLSLNDDQVQLQGQSKEAASLITVLQQSALMEGPALQGAITPDARTGKEQFLIQAKAKLKSSSSNVPATRGAKSGVAAPAEETNDGE